ncbi:hypothetical protein U9M48_004850 [Paspalum notatum var. saurae]|uniref:Reverse transcriptase domain-containing protein n=1 Tax=Paspalum notatum var. saurae TaxID=547442 RepID=A0AAQ3PKL7_PASNO
MDETRHDDIPQVSELENEILVSPFSEEEVKMAVFQMKHNTAPGPNGFQVEFYQTFWINIKEDLMALFTEFHKGTLPLHSLNFGTIILLPKGNDVKQIQQYRPICLLNVSFKIFTKVITNRITSIAARVIKPTQTAFLPGRNIMEGAVILHETIHELHTKKQNGVVFKIDFEKAYDKVRWEFLQQALRMKGFNSTWCTWVQTCVQGGNVGIKVNDQLGSYFQTRKGLRQGDPLSPVLFNIVVDMLAIIVSRAKAIGLFKGVVPHLVDDGLSILQYADDTVLFLDHDLDQAKNMKLVLCLFEQLSGLKINFHKSELFCFGEAKEWESQYSNLFGCKVGSYPFRYLGIPMHFRKLNNKDWKMIEERIERKLSNWKGKMLSFGGRLVLLNSVLSSLPMVMLSFFEIPRGVLKKIEYFRSRFFWQYDNHKNKYRLISWPILCQPKEQGGLGVQNLDIQNKCLLSKWLFKLCNEDGIWQDLLRNKYLKGNSLSQTQKKPRDSHFWKSLIGVKNQFLCLGWFKLKGTKGNKFNEWHNLVARIASVNLQKGRDQFVWGLHSKGYFSASSMHKHLVSNGLKLRSSFGFLRGVILTKDNLAKRNCKGRRNCEFCSKQETIQHLFFECHYAKFLWRAVHCIFGLTPPINTGHLLNVWSKQGGKRMVQPLLTGAATFCWAIWLTRNEVLFRRTHWIRLWAQLQRTDDERDVMVQACKFLESAALSYFASHG